MNGILDDLSSPVWWFTVVLIGIVVNIFAAYLKNKSDDFLSKISSWWSSDSKKRKEAHKNRLKAMKMYPEERKKVEILYLRNLFRSILYLLFAFFLFTTTGTFRSLMVEYSFHEVLNLSFRLILIACYAFVVLLLIISLKSYIDSIQDKKDIFEILDEIVRENLPQ